MKLKLTKFQLANHFFSGYPVELDNKNSMVIQKIERENNSTHSYNIFGYVNKSIYISEFYVVTID